MKPRTDDIYVIESTQAWHVVEPEEPLAAFATQAQAQHSGIERGKAKQKRVVLCAASAEIRLVLYDPASLD